MEFGAESYSSMLTTWQCGLEPMFLGIKRSKPTWLRQLNRTTWDTSIPKCSWHIQLSGGPGIYTGLAKQIAHLWAFGLVDRMLATDRCMDGWMDGWWVSNCYADKSSKSIIFPLKACLVH